MRGRRIILIASGTLGDILPVARLYTSLRGHGDISVLTSKRYFQWFDGAELMALPFDPNELLQSVAGQRLMEGGAFGLRRLAGLYGVVHSHIVPSVEAAKNVLPKYDLAVVSGIPFLTGEITSQLGVPVIRLLFQPHWPTAELRSLYLNTPKNFGSVANKSSHLGVEWVARAMFCREISEALSPMRRTRTNLLHDSYWFNQTTLFLLSDPFTHSTIRDCPRAVVAGFVRPPLISDSPEFVEALRP